MGSSQSLSPQLQGCLIDLLYPGIPANVREELEREFPNIKFPTGVTGGAEYTGGYESSVFGGKSDALQKYGDTVYSKQKEKLIRAIATEVFDVLKMKGGKFAQTAPLSDVVAHLRKSIPGPSSGKPFNKSFNSNKSGQEQVCKGIASAINKHFGSQVINTSADVATQCSAIAEFMHTLLMGMHTEFMAVAGDILRVMKNMAVLNKALEASEKRQVELVSKSGDAGLVQNSQAALDLSKQLRGELDRQMSMLSNMVNISVGPTGKSLIKLLEDNEDFSGMVKDLKADLGSKNFAQKISYMLSGVSSVAYAADVINKALKTLGMSVAEFKNAKNARDLRLKIYDHIHRKKPDSRALDKLMDAATLIEKHDYDHDAISKVMDGKSGAGESYTGGADSDLEDDEGAYWNKKSLSRKIKKKDKYRDLILKDFKKVLQAHYQKMVNAIGALSKEVGKSIPVNDDLDRFIKVLGVFPSLNQDGLEKILSGYQRDTSSKAKREEYLNNYELLVLAAEECAKGPGSKYFNDLKASIKATVKTMDDFNDNLVKAVTEITPDRPDDISHEVRRTINDFFVGSGDSDNDTAAAGNAFVQLDVAKNEIVYRYNIANIKDNLKVVAEETKHFGKDYEQVLGEEAGWLINKIKRLTNERKEKSKPLDTAATAVDTGAFKFAGDGAANAAGAAANMANTEAHRTYCKWLDMMCDAKVKMVDISQAVDLYLKSFSDGLARNPDSIRSVVKMLEQVEIVANWFNNKSGDSLTAVFESFPKGNNNALYDNPPDPTQLVTGVYYEKLQEAINTSATPADLPSNPFLGIPMLADAGADADAAKTNADTRRKKLEDVRDRVKKAVKTMRALENILSAFQSVGKKLGDVVPQASSFMSPAQIFNALCDYITVSAFAVEFLPTNADTNKTLLTGIRDTTLVGSNIPSIGGNQNDFRPPSSGANANLPVQPNGAFTNHANRNDRGLPCGTQNNAQGKSASVALAGLPNDFADKWSYHDLSNEGPKMTHSGWRDEFADTDLLFQMTVKSIVAKVLTMVDAYRLFNCPMNLEGANRRNTYSLNPLRTIMGGASYTKVIPDACELYLRLPLLVEWYREVFGFNSTGTLNAVRINNADWVLAIVPSVEGVWSDLVSLVFDRAEYVKEGNYSENLVRRMIDAINGVYTAYKKRNKNVSIRSMINAFCLEMNRVFGFLKRSDITEYTESRRRHLGIPGDIGDDNTNDFLGYDILDAEDAFDGRGPAPSDRFVNVHSKTEPRKRNRVNVHLMKQIEELRNKMDMEFLNHERTFKADNFSFITTIQNYQTELANSSSDKDKYEVVLRMIQGSSKLVQLNAAKLIMVHEAVAVPLSQAERLMAVLNNFNNLLHATSLKTLTTWGVDTSPSGGNAINITDRAAVHNAFAAWLATQPLYKNARKDRDGNYPQLTSIASILTVDTSSDIADTYIRSNAAIGGGTDLTMNHINHVKILRDILGAVLDLCSSPQSLVQCKVGTGGAVNIDFSAAEDLLNELLTLVKDNMQKLRLEFPNNWKAMFGHYETAVNRLTENIEVVIRNRDSTGLELAVNEHLRETLKRCTTDGVGSIQEAVKTYIYYDNQARGGGHDGMRANNLKEFPFNVIPLKMDSDAWDTQHKAVMKKMLADGNASVVNAAAAPPGVIAVNDDEALKQLTDVPAVIFAPRNSPIYSFGSTNIRSLLFAFNELVHNYLKDSLDESNTKMYTGLFESFMHGAAANEVIQGNAFPNVVAPAVGDTPWNGGNSNLNSVFNTPNGTMLPPKPNSVLFASTAVALKGLLHTMDVRLKKKRHIYDTLSEVPEHVRDRLKANLPLYSKLFTTLVNRAQLLRDLISNTDLKKSMAWDANVNGTTQVSGRVKAVTDELADAPADSEEHATLCNGILNHLIELCNGVKKCADKTYKELQDTAPYFMDTSRDFIADYKATNGVLPIMPASNVTLPQEKATGTDQMLLPTNANGSVNYKFNRASRLLLARDDVEPTLDHMPGAKDIFNKYSSVANKRSSVSAQAYSRTVLTMVKVARYLNNGCYSLFVSGRSNGSTAFAPVAQVGGAGASGNNATGSTYKTFQRVYGDAGVFGLAENPNQDAKLTEFAGIVGTVHGEAQGDRAQLRVHNIIDLNIVPINYHAFMREVPFTNLLNYSHTFDRMVHDLILPDYLSNAVSDAAGRAVAPADIMITNAPSTANTAKELMVKLLCHPWAPLDEKEYWGLLGNLFNGNDDLPNLGRPRYLSDQVWGKALLTSAAQDVGRATVLGPAGMRAQAEQVRFGPRGTPPFDPLTDEARKVSAVKLFLLATCVEADITAHVYTKILENLKAFVRAAIVANDAANSATVIAFLNNNAAVGGGNTLATVQAAVAGNNTEEVVMTAMETHMHLNRADANLVNALLSAVCGETGIANVRGLINLEINRYLTTQITAGPVGGIASLNAIITRINTAGAAVGDSATYNLVSSWENAKADSVDILNRNMNNGGISDLDIRVRGNGRPIVQALTNVIPAGNTLRNVRDLLLSNNLPGQGLDDTKLANLNTQLSTQTVINAINVVNQEQHLSVSASVRKLLTYARNHNHDYTSVNALMKALSLTSHTLGVTVNRSTSIVDFQSTPPSTQGLKYWDGSKWTYGNNPIKPADVIYCGEIGRARFDTRFCRNMVWLVQLQRIMRHTMVKHLAHLNTPVVRGIRIADAKVTEYDGNDAWAFKDYAGN